MATRVELNKAELRRITRSPAGPVMRDITATARRVVAGAKRRCRVNSGQLRASIDFALFIEPNRVVCRIGSDLEYALWQHEGTGIYGPKRAWIRPVHKKVLKFPVKGVFGPVAAGKKRSGRGDIVFALKVAGVPPNPFLVDALQDEFGPGARLT